MNARTLSLNLITAAAALAASFGAHADSEYPYESVAELANRHFVGATAAGHQNNAASDPRSAASPDAWKALVTGHFVFVGSQPKTDQRAQAGSDRKLQ